MTEYEQKLRDKIAIAAMNALIISARNGRSGSTIAEDVYDAYDYADKMLEERAKVMDYIDNE
jgi:hypothetical protein